LRCEVCGRQIRGEARKVVIEGARMLACEDCAKLGSPYFEPEVGPPRMSGAPIKTARTIPSVVPRLRVTMEKLSVEKDFVENFGSLIRESRERLGLSHKELGRRIGEKVSVIKKLETEKMLPDEMLATKLERMLKVRLLIRSEQHEISQPVSSPQPPNLTLGEIARLKTGKRRNPQDESTSS